MQIEFTSTKTTEKENVNWENLNKEQSLKRNLDLILPQEGEKIYDRKVSQKIIRFAEKKWTQIRDRSERFIKDEGFSVPNRLTCILTQWGCGGAFKPKESIIIVRLKRSSDFDRFGKTLIHEILHLLTFKDGQSYKEREQIVNKLVGEIEAYFLVNKSKALD